MKGFYDLADFPWTQHLVDNWEEIRGEVDQLTEQWSPTYSAFAEYIEKENKPGMPWKTCILVFFSINNLDACEACPKTYSVLEKIPNVSVVMFSRLDPHAHIPAHEGYTTDVLRCHLGLTVPEPDKCILRVGDEKRNWREGEVLVFDDTVEHEVWNHGDASRTILMIDTVRPELDYDAKEVGRRHFNGRGRLDPWLMRAGSHDQWLQWIEDGHFPREVTAG